MDIAESLAYDMQEKIKLTEEMILEFEQNEPQKAIELRGRLYEIQVILNEIEDEYLELAGSLN